jgi:hypothetical protein
MYIYISAIAECTASGSRGPRYRRRDSVKEELEQGTRLMN